MELLGDGNDYESAPAFNLTISSGTRSRGDIGEMSYMLPKQHEPIVLGVSKQEILDKTHFNRFPKHLDNQFISKDL